VRLGVFISYRREDSAGFARLIYNRLTERLGRDSVFFDVDNIPVGLDFVDILSDSVGKCDALVAVIGKNWVSSSDVPGRRRLDDPNDFVRVEIEAALARQIRVIPVLVDGAAMPHAEELPDSMKKLIRRQGIEISHTRFDADVGRLTRALSSLEEELRQREAAERAEQARLLAAAEAAARAEREEAEKRAAAEAAERAEQARLLAAADVKPRAEAEREEAEKRAAAEAAERAEQARLLAAAEAKRRAEAEHREPQLRAEVRDLRTRPAGAASAERTSVRRAVRNPLILVGLAGASALAVGALVFELGKTPIVHPRPSRGEGTQLGPPAPPAPDTSATSANATQPAVVHPNATAPEPASPSPGTSTTTANAKPRTASREAPKPSESAVSPGPLNSQVISPAPSTPVQLHLVAVEPLTQEGERALRAKEAFKECADCPEVTVVPSGAFMMGSSASDIEKGRAFPNEGPDHRVFIHQRFALARHEVTRDEFEAFVAATRRPIDDRCYTLEDGKPRERQGRSFRNPGFAQTGDHPAVCVSWLEATAYAEWLSRTTGKTYRLPSEAEYEYAARGGSDLRFGSTADPSDLCRFVNGADQSAKQAGLPRNWNFLDCTDGYPYTAPVGAFPPNALGLSDLLGNVWEWTAECYHVDFRTASSDGSIHGANLCIERAVRGGAWSSPAALLRPSVRTKAVVHLRYDDVGFRVMRELEP
jgi:formylglycine-generating enzyme required for sulfatase activity